MTARTTSWLSVPSLWRTLVAHARLSLRLLREPAVPMLTKLLPLVAALYLLSPIDGVPDFIPVLGQLDDLGVLLLALESFLRLCPDDVVTFHRAAIANRRGYSAAPAGGRGQTPPGTVIDAEFRRDDVGR